MRRNERNKFDKKDSLELGQQAENLFEACARRRDWEVNPASKDENIDEHWDFKITKGNDSFRVEVKSLKRVAREDEFRRPEYTWVELHGVRPKDTGWLFGKADLIAFEKINSFLLVKKSDLLALVNQKVNLVAKVAKPEDALYKIYKRRGRKDKLTLLLTSDIENIKYDEWNKI